MKLLYGATIALSAFLLFSVEPMITRALLPQVGGSSAVWMTALAFFQVILLIGCAYAAVAAHASSRRRGVIVLHLALLVASGLSVLLPRVRICRVVHYPQARLFLSLLLTVGLPFFTLSTTAPLLQAWYARREQTARRRYSARNTSRIIVPCTLGGTSTRAPRSLR